MHDTQVFDSNCVWNVHRRSFSFVFSSEMSESVMESIKDTIGNSMIKLICKCEIIGFLFNDHRIMVLTNENLLFFDQQNGSMKLQIFHKQIKNLELINDKEFKFYRLNSCFRIRCKQEIANQWIINIKSIQSPKKCL